MTSFRYKIFLGFMSLGFLLMSPNTSASQLFLNDLEELRANPQSLEQAMPVFVDKWRQSFLILKQNAPYNENDEKAYKTASHLFFNLLWSHYSETGIQFFSKTCCLEHRLALAGIYFQGQPHFNAPNVPTQPHDLLTQAAVLYRGAIIEIIGLQKKCLHELDHALAQDKSFEDLAFTSLSFSTRANLLSYIRGHIERLSSPIENKPENIKLKLLKPHILDAIRKLIVYITDVSSTQNKPEAAWCLFYVWKEFHLAHRIHTHAKSLSILRRMEDIPDFQDWLMGTQPYMTIEDVTPKT